MSMSKVEEQYGKLHISYGNCMICDTPMTAEEDKPVDCYNPQCIEARKNMEIPEGWVITPYEKSFKAK